MTSPRFLRRSWPLLLALALVGCRSEAAPPERTVPSALDPTAVVSELLEAVAEGRFEDTAELTDQGQAGLLSLAEGAEINEVVAALEEDPGGVAANFWSGFAQTLDPAFSLEGEGVTLEAGERMEQGGERYVEVVLTDAAGEERNFYLRHDGGWKVDLMATFAPVVAERLTPRVEALLTSANPNAAAVVNLLKESTPSLHVAAANPDSDVATHQALLALIERITRAG